MMALGRSTSTYFHTRITRRLYSLRSLKRQTGNLSSRGVRVFYLAFCTKKKRSPACTNRKQNGQGLREFLSMCAAPVEAVADAGVRFCDLSLGSHVKPSSLEMLELRTD